MPVLNRHAEDSVFRDVLFLRGFQTERDRGSMDAFPESYEDVEKRIERRYVVV
jgi:hypothetical protein